MTKSPNENSADILLDGVEITDHVQDMINAMVQTYSL